MTEMYLSCTAVYHPSTEVHCLPTTKRQNKAKRSDISLDRDILLRSGGDQTRAESAYLTKLKYRIVLLVGWNLLYALHN